MTEIKSMIVDDDKLSRDFVAHLIHENFPDISIIAKCSSVQEAKIKLDSNKVDLLFLDVKMSNENGFDLLSLYPKRSFKVIFISAYDEYAFKAFKVNASDYLLKPINKNRFVASVEHVSKHYANENISENLMNTFLLPKKGGAIVVNFDDVCYLQALNNYCIIHMLDGKEFIVSKTLKDFAIIFNSDFLRIHKSYLVNLSCIYGYLRSDGITLQLKNGKCIPVSRRKQGLFMKRFNSI